MSLASHIASQIYRNFGFEPTLAQKKAIEQLAVFLTPEAQDRIFILNGYAGTGKTTLIAALVQTLREMRISSVLLAPTGRAAKVMSRYAGAQAYTIHKKIYRQRSLSSEEASFTLDYNREKGAVFIVDEASMLSNFSSEGAIFGSGQLLEDLMTYIRKGVDCRLLLVGDKAQLPPVGHEESPALDVQRMGVYGTVDQVLLDDVMRQSVDSGILFNATLVRCMLEQGIERIPRFDLSFPDVEAVEGGEILERLQDAYDRYGMEETVIITRSNKRANRFNEAVRRNVRFCEEEIESGDLLMVVKNNYHYTSQDKECGLEFIANGDTARLVRFRREETLYGFRFAQAQLSFPDYDGVELEGKILLDTLHSDAPALTREQHNQLFWAVVEDYADISPKAKRYKQVREDPYFNAIQVKFAYAVTCHKAQGGQWRCVFVDRMLFGEEELNRDLLRWLYTALTRATEKLYLINFDERFFAK
ncbi:MAG: AAA family ATPase [Alistipes sp.]|nr:AAA family ATPase [Alistipes sp.]